MSVLWCGRQMSSVNFLPVSVIRMDTARKLEGYGAPCHHCEKMILDNEFVARSRTNGTKYYHCFCALSLTSWTTSDYGWSSLRSSPIDRIVSCSTVCGRRSSSLAGNNIEILLTWIISETVPCPVLSRPLYRHDLQRLARFHYPETSYSASHALHRMIFFNPAAKSENLSDSRIRGFSFYFHQKKPQMAVNEYQVGFARS